MVPRVVGSSPTRHPKLGYRITVNISDSDSGDCGSNPYIPTNLRSSSVGLEHLFITKCLQNNGN